jgi:hypothetical protein
LRAKIAVAREGKTELQTLMDRTRELPPPGMDLPTGVKMPASLTFRDAASRDVFTAISRLANISVIFDSTVRDTPVTVDPPERHPGRRPHDRLRRARSSA